MSVLGVIPARWGSTRLPGKALLPIAGKSLIQRVFERARMARTLDALLVATDDQRIAEAVRGFGGEAVMTSPEHPSGTDRVAEAVRIAPAGAGAEIVVNIQGDEPMLDPDSIDTAVEGLRADGACGIATLSSPIGSVDELFRPQVVKVVADGRGRALYFSRSPVPFLHGARDIEELRRRLQADPGALARYRRHVGLYAYRREALERFVALPPSEVEKMEGLEQLRALEGGIPILVLATREHGIGVDTAEDLELARALLERPVE